MRIAFRRGLLTALLALSACSGPDPVHVTLAPADASAGQVLGLARAAWDAGDPEASLRLYRVAAERARRPAPLLDEAAARAAHAYGAREALVLLEAAMAASPGRPEPFRRIGTELARVYQPVATARIWARGLVHVPGDPDITRGLAAMRERQEDRECVASLYRRAVAAHPEVASLKTDLAAVLLRLGRRDEAEAICRDVLATAPGDAAARAILAILDPLPPARGGEDKQRP